MASQKVEDLNENNVDGKGDVVVVLNMNEIENNNERVEWTQLKDDSGREKVVNHFSSTVIDSSIKFDKNNGLLMSSNHSVGSTGSGASATSRGSGNSKRRATKRRSWKKPKDKPKRPLSAYNIFFKHTRSRIVQGLPEEGSMEETIQSIEAIVSNSTETRRHRKTHGQISFSDLAKKVADSWKTVSEERRSLFDHYAGLDMKRYRRDLAIWKCKKEQEAKASKTSLGMDGTAGLGGGNSLHSNGSYFSDYSDTENPGNSISSQDMAAKFRTGSNDSLSSSFHSFGSNIDNLEPVPIADIEIVERMNQSNRFADREIAIAPFIDSIYTMQQQHHNDGGSTGNSTDSEINEKKLNDIRMKNLALEQSINQLKMELSATNFLGVNGSDSKPIERQQQQMLQQQQPILGMNAPFSGGPSIERIHSFHRRRQLMQNSSIKDIVNTDIGSNLGIEPISGVQNSTNRIMDNCEPSNFQDAIRSQTLKLEEGFDTPILAPKKSVSQQVASATPMSTADMSPVPFNQVFSNKSGDSLKLPF